MNQATKDKWIAELRNPENKQAFGILHIELEGGTVCRCCLGVLCDVLNIKAANMTDGTASIRDNGSSVHANGVITQYLFDDNEARCVTIPLQLMQEHKIAEMELVFKNDSLKWTFPQIADFLEQELQVTE